MAVATIVRAGVIAGVLDLLAAFANSWLRAGTSPVRVMQSIAAGALGPAARTGGAGSAALGVAFHFLIATVAAAVFYIASRRLRWLVAHPIICGVLYGIAVYTFMNFVVIPLSAIPGGAAPPLTQRLIGCTIIVVCVGLPIAAVVRRAE